MLHDLTFDIFRTPVPGPVRTLSATTEFRFYLTGSRYMGGATPDSDWDFMTQDSDEVRRYLTEVNFLPLGRTTGEIAASVNDAGRPASATNEVWADGIVQVQLVKNVKIKRKVRDLIKQHNFEYHLHANIHERDALWNAWWALLNKRTEQDLITERALKFELIPGDF